MSTKETAQNGGVEADGHGYITKDGVEILVIYAGFHPVRDTRIYASIIFDETLKSMVRLRAGVHDLCLALDPEIEYIASNVRSQDCVIWEVDFDAVICDLPVLLSPRMCEPFDKSEKISINAWEVGSGDIFYHAQSEHDFEVTTDTAPMFFIDNKGLMVEISLTTDDGIEFHLYTHKVPLHVFYDNGGSVEC